MKDTGERLIPEGHTQTLTYGEHLARYAAVKKIAKGKVVLDVACGAGYGAALLAETAQKVIGIDYSKEAIEYSKRLYPLKNVEFIVGDARSMPVEDHSIDVVVSLETIEHIPDPEKFVQEVVRVLKPGGVFYVSTPNDNEFTEGNVFHVHEFDFKELSRLMKKYFKITDYYYQGSWFSSGVLSKTSFTEQFYRESKLPVSKTFSQPASKAIFYVAVASDSDVPDLTENIVISDTFSDKASQEQHLQQLNQVKDLDAKVQDAQSVANKLDQENAVLRTELKAIHNSRGWRLLKKAYVVKNIPPRVLKKVKRKNRE